MYDRVLPMGGGGGGGGDVRSCLVSWGRGENVRSCFTNGGGGGVMYDHV